MAAQTFITDLQAMNPGSVQVQQGASVVKAASAGSANQTAAKVGGTTIIQPAQTSSGQQFIVTTTVAEHPDAAPGETALQQGAQTVYPTQVQNNFQEYQPNAMYTSVAGAYYQTTPGSQVTATGLVPVQAMQGQIIQQSSGTFLIQGGAMDNEGTPLSHTTRASPATVQWLLDNYETAEGVSLPRSTLYFHYLRHCQEQNLDPMNPASFGKLIRSVFLGLRTRRLGTRGNSKYHYYGIRIKATSPLNQFTDEQTIPMRQQPIFHNKKPTKMEDGETDGSHQSNHSVSSQEAPTSQQQQHQMFLGSLGGIPKFGEVSVAEEPLPDGISLADVRTFEVMYREHAESIIDVVVNLQFPLIEALWTGFWRNPTSEIGDNEYEKKLSREKLYILCQYEPVRKYVRKSDYAFYQAIVEVLIPDVLRPIPSSLTQAIRNFAKSLENWLRGAMQGVPEDMVKTKMGAVSAFAQTLRRYTSLNHLAQAARAVLQNTSQINQMLTDLNRVDFANVQEQASWVCQCEDPVVLQLQEDFKKTLKEQNNLEQWAIWLEGVVDQILKAHEGSANFPKAARQFLLKWSFYSSMVIRDLTLRSAASFGSFHLIRLLYDEYMFYLVEHKVACATGATPIAVMGEVRQFADLGGVMNLSTLEASSPPSSLAPASSAPTPVPVMLVANTNSAAATATTSSPSLPARPTTNGITTSTPASSRVGNSSTVLVVAQGSSAGQAGTTSTVTGSQANTITTFRNQGGAAGKQPIQTILVMSAPMGDGPAAKRLKTE